MKIQCPVSSEGLPCCKHGDKPDVEGSPIQISARTVERSRPNRQADLIVIREGCCRCGAVTFRVTGWGLERLMNLHEKGKE